MKMEPDATGKTKVMDIYPPDGLIETLLGSIYADITPKD